MKTIKKTIISIYTKVCMLNCVHDSVLQRNYKTMIFTYFYNNIKIEEYYSYSFSLTI